MRFESFFDRREFVEEAARSRARYGTEIVLELFFVHSDAIVVDDESLGILVDDHLDGRLECDGLVGFVRNAEVTELVDGVGSVGDEFAEENLLVGIKRMHD